MAMLYYDDQPVCDVNILRYTPPHRRMQRVNFLGGNSAIAKGRTEPGIIIFQTNNELEMDLQYAIDIDNQRRNIEMTGHESKNIPSIGHTNVYQGYLY